MPDSIYAYCSANSYSGPIISIIVGPDDSQHTFTVHKSFLVAYSTFFALALDEETIDRSMRFIDIELGVFAHLVEWLYYRKIPHRVGVGAAINLSRAKLWTLANRFLMSELQNQIIRSLFRVVENRSGVPQEFIGRNQIFTGIDQAFIDHAGSSGSELLQKLATDVLKFLFDSQLQLALEDFLVTEC